jgi:MFS family permease
VSHPPRSPRGFWISAVLLAFFLAASSTPSTLYSRYATQWHFSHTTLTVIFAVYAVALLATLLTCGGLSDAVGRKPVISVALLLLALSQCLFLLASGVTWLICARIVQGVATGLATAAIPAALLDQQPPHRPGLAAQIIASASTAGLAVGALLSGVLVQYAPAPTQLSYCVILGSAVALGLIAHLFTDDSATVRRRSRLTINLSVEPALRPLFLAAAPCLIATWAISGFYLSLGPSVVNSLTHHTGALLGGLAIAVLTGCGTAGAVATHLMRSRTAMLAGCALLITGSSLTSVSVATASVPLFFTSTAFAGLGFGAAYLGSYRTLVELAEPAHRSALVAAIFTVAYLAMASASIIAGTLATRFELHSTAIGFGLAVAALAALATVATVRTTDRPDYRAGPDTTIVPDSAAANPR